MRVLLIVNGRSQYSSYILPEYHISACGPTTAHVILNYLCEDETIRTKDVNELYKFLGRTKIGLFKWRMIRNLRRLLGDDCCIEECTLTQAIEQLRLGNPVAMKFDVYFIGQVSKSYTPRYKYHWVPLIGYEIKEDRKSVV